MPMTFLTATDLFRGVTEAESQRIVRLCTDRHYPKGKVLFTRGDLADSLFILKEGLVKVLSHSSMGTETILLILKPGMVFGELLFSESRRPFTTVAATDVVVTVVSRQSLGEIFSSIPTVTLNFIKLLSSRLVKVEQTFAEYGHTWSYHRLARALLNLSEEYGKTTPGGTLLALGITHEELANLIGTTRETVTKQLGKFEQMKILKRIGRKLLLDIPRLKSIASVSSEE